MKQSTKTLQRIMLTIGTIALVIWWNDQFMPWGLLMLAILALLWIQNPRDESSK